MPRGDGCIENWPDSERPSLKRLDCAMLDHRRRGSFTSKKNTVLILRGSTPTSKQQFQTC